MRKTLGFLLFTIQIATVAIAQMAAPPGPSDTVKLLQNGQSLLDDGKTLEAARYFDKALSMASTGDDVELVKRALFFVGRANWELAALEDEHRDEYATRSISAYEKLLEVEPKNGAVINNLAKVYADRDPEKAIQLFQKAIEIGGDLQSLYLANLGELLAKNGRRDEAIGAYEKVVAARPDDRSSEEALLRLYSPQQVSQYLWRLLDAGSVERAQTLAFDRLSNPGGASPEDKRDLLDVVAVSLAKQHISARDFTRHPGRSRLDALMRQDPDVRTGAQELLRLIAGTSLDPQSYSWWRQGWATTSPVYDSVTAFTSVARQLAEEQQSAGDPKKAEAYLRLALDISVGRDPDVMLALTDLYYRTGRKDEIQKLMPYMEEMFSEKGQAYQKGDWQKIYRYHVALGNIYARLGSVGDAGDIRSAVFQLEHARDAAAQYNRLHAGAPPIVVDPKVVDLLAETYSKSTSTNAAAKTTELRLSAAQSYADAGRTASAARVLKPIAANPSVLRPTDRARFDRIISVVPTKGGDLKIEYAPKAETTPKTEVKPKTEYTPVKPETVKVIPAATTAVTHIGPTKKIATMPHVVMTRAQLRLPEGAAIRTERVDAITGLLTKYVTAPADQRKKIEAELQKIGVSEIKPPVDGKGALMLVDDKNRWLTATYVVRP